ncbi:redoxin domain-containing protein, partial [Escherichia coli]
MQPLSAGTLAPDFSLSDQDGNPVRLSDLRGKKVLIYFYPKAMTPGCTTQACGLRDVNSELAARGVVVLGISPDPAKRLKKFEERDSLNFRL